VGIWMAVIAVGSLVPGATALPASDFVFHAFAYGVLAWLLARALAARPALLNAVGAAVLAWLFGFLLEGAQSFHPDRTYEVRDLIANAYGVAGGAVLALLLPGRLVTVLLVLAISGSTLSLGPRGLGALVLAQPAPQPTQLGLVTLPQGGLQAARGVGIRAVKILADWSQIEARQGEVAWGSLDRAVTAAHQEGIMPILVLAHTPRWASVATGVDLNRAEIYSRQPPRDVRDWERFVAAAAARYRDRVRAWQIWTQLSLPHYRGTGSEYLALLRGARARIRAADPGARVAIATPGGMDLGFVVRAVTNAAESFDTISLAPHDLAPEALVRPLAALSVRLRSTGKSLWMEYGPEAGHPAERAAAFWARLHAIAQAAGVERLFAIDLARAEPGVRQMGAVLASRPYVGYLVRDPDVFALVFGGADPVVVAWARPEGRTLELSASPTLRARALDGQTLSVETREGRVLVRLSEAPVIVSGVSPGVVDEAQSTAASRGPLLPTLAPDRDYSRGVEVTARLGRGGEEHGLYNQPFRTRRNGAVEPVEVGGTEAVRTNVGRDVMYVYFDVDDSFLYFVEGGVPVEVTVEVWGAGAPRVLGFNLLYDSTGGYRFTPWHWVEARQGWVTYTIRIADANFANTWGWDFAINAAGNRVENLTVRVVRVRKEAP